MRGSLRAAGGRGPRCGQVLPAPAPLPGGAGWSQVEPARPSRPERGRRRGGRAHTRWTCLSCSAGTGPAAGRWQPLARHPSGRAAGRFSVFPRRPRTASAFRGVQPSDAGRPEGSLLAAGVRRGRRARVPESMPRPHACLLRGRLPLLRWRGGCFGSSVCSGCTLCAGRLPEAVTAAREPQLQCRVAVRPGRTSEPSRRGRPPRAPGVTERGAEALAGVTPPRRPKGA